MSLPASSCDCHTHVFGPYERFPLAAERSYTPPEAPVESLLRMLDDAGLSRAVVVQPSAYGLDCSALLDALARGSGHLRGVAVIDRHITETRLAELHAAGVRGARFTETGTTPAARFSGSVGIEEIAHLAPRLREAGWHLQIWAGLDTLEAALPGLLRKELPIVLDHMGMPDVSSSVRNPAFQRLLGPLREGRLWIKLTPQRISRSFPGYEDVRPFHEALIAANASRLLWASDWPFLRMGERTPALHDLTLRLLEWTRDESVRQLVLVDNPAALYGF